MLVNFVPRPQPQQYVAVTYIHVTYIAYDLSQRAVRVGLLKRGGLGSVKEERESPPWSKGERKRESRTKVSWIPTVIDN